jgi:hypothetical protein
MLTQKYGIIIKKPQYMITDQVDVLARSFISKADSIRNPLIGKRKEKGLKNVSRIKNLAKIVKIPPHVREFIDSIEHKRFAKSKKIAQIIAG